MFDATGHERVKAKIKKMKPIPADANPFHHDDWSMGTSLPRGWVVMHPGYDRKEDPRSMDWLYLVNTRTGQRIRIELDHKVPFLRLKKLHLFVTRHHYDAKWFFKRKWNRFLSWVHFHKALKASKAQLKQMGFE